MKLLNKKAIFIVIVVCFLTLRMLYGASAEEMGAFMGAAFVIYFVLFEWIFKEEPANRS